MCIESVLGRRIHKCDIEQILALVSDSQQATLENLFELTGNCDIRSSYNALWVLTHIKREDLPQLYEKRDFLINMLLKEQHIGKQRLILKLLSMLPVQRSDIRTDYLDFCISKINSRESYAIRAFCLKQAFEMCRLYPELMYELKLEIEILCQESLSPGIKSVVKNIHKKLES